MASHFADMCWEMKSWYVAGLDESIEWREARAICDLQSVITWEILAINDTEHVSTCSANVFVSCSCLVSEA